MSDLLGIAVSNLAWRQEDFPQALCLSKELGLDAIEIAPYHVFGRWDVGSEELLNIRRQIEDAGLTCAALQGLLFNVVGAELFTGERSRELLAAQLRRIAWMAELLGARACVFGAPRQRDPGLLSPESAWSQAVEFLRSIGPIFADHGSVLAFEANARTYGCRFVTTTADALNLVRDVNNSGVALQIDTGTMLLEGEDPEILLHAAPYAVHAHVSEPNLDPIGSGDVNHGIIGNALRMSSYSGFVSIEMRRTDDWEAALRRAAGILRSDYA